MNVKVEADIERWDDYLGLLIFFVNSDIYG